MARRAFQLFESKLGAWQAGGASLVARRSTECDSRKFLVSDGSFDPPNRSIGTMKNLALKVQRFLVSEDGPTAVEYAVMLALIVIVCLTAIQAIGTNANVTFNEVASKLGTTGGS
jgi:pilus assembly protein Flp/PilA